MPERKTAIFIDGSNVYATCKALRRNIDYSLLIPAFGGRHDQGGTVVNAFYYTAVNEGDDTPLIPLLDWLSYNGYTVVRKPSKKFTDPLTGMTKIKGNMDIEIAVHAMKLRDSIDNAVLFTGDGDFTSLVLALQDKAVHVTAVSSITVQPAMIADELRRAVNSFIEISELPIFNKDKREGSRYG